MSSQILKHALKIPAIEKLKNKKIVLASSSPRRKEILQTFGIAPEIVASTFKEDLDFYQFPEPHEYPVATATHKAIEVYERLVEANPDDAPDLVIAADTVVLTHTQPVTSDTAYSVLPQVQQELLEKPKSKEDNMRMLLDLKGNVCEVVTGVTIVYPILTAPGYQIKSIDERSLVYFADVPNHIIQAYVDSGEGIDRAGGFAIQSLGGILVRKIEGDYNNVVGFPAASFFALLDLLIEEDTDFLEV
ncbi:inosine triphosphate pyrophosphatase-like protein [Crepidotus variabilis]|uniref:Inosine triphosphate pyrophosphatase-like protein n=1 Tax=Crepidotus variabilis TaxID=179855 RepID=A0A9P6JJH0_9AGAR|nr:inosine triphosphate pyrophosphatase-like protein [Crepidotus variabilis]